MHNKRVKLTQTLDGTLRIILPVCLMVIAAAFIVYGYSTAKSMRFFQKPRLFAENA